MDYYSLKESLSYPGLLIKLLRANSGIPAGSKENIEIIDTYRHLKGEQRVPLLCIHGDKDPLVELECSASFVSKVNELSPGKAELIVVKDGLHSNLAALFWGDMKTENAKLLAWLGKRGEG